MKLSLFVKLTLLAGLIQLAGWEACALDLFTFARVCMAVSVALVFVIGLALMLFPVKSSNHRIE